MKFHEHRIAKLDENKLPKEVFGDGRGNRTTNDEYWGNIEVGDIVFPTVWFLRNIEEVDEVAAIAANGLTVVEKGYTYVREGEWGIGGWSGAHFNCLWFKETSRPLSFQYSISQQIWKIKKKKPIRLTGRQKELIKYLKGKYRIDNYYHDSSHCQVYELFYRNRKVTKISGITVRALQKKQILDANHKLTELGMSIKL